MSGDLVYVLVEMWPPWRSIVTSRKLTDVVKIFEVVMMLLVNAVDEIVLKI